MQLAFREIEKRFGERQVLDGVSFTATGGKAFGLLGRNGAGKTTSIRILMDVFPADAGAVTVDDAVIDHDQITIGYLPEERGLYPKKKIIDQLVYFARLHGMRRADAVVSVDKWLNRLEMQEYRDKRLDTLSKGNQQKIQLITALAHDPHIVILDEPFSGLDPVNAQLLKDVVREEIARGKIVLFSSHQMNYIEAFCDRIAILHHGKIVLEGDLTNIKRSYPREKLIVRSVESFMIKDTLKERCDMQPDGSLLVHLPSPSDKKQMIQALAERFDIDEISVYEPSLEDIFVSYASDDEITETEDAA